MSYTSHDLFQAIIKFLTLVDVQAVNLSYMGLRDTQIRLMSSVLKSSTSLKSLNLNGNELTNVGLQILAISLQSNKSLVHLSLKKCRELTDLTWLVDLVKHHSQTLCSIEIDNLFDEPQHSQLQHECTLNRKIQMYLKPTMIDD
jgi:hypothetical protein